MNGRNIRQEDYLLKAKEAEEQAAQAKDQTVRERWIRIAETYGALARQAEKSL